MSSQDSTAPIQPGALFGERYRIERVLDEGGMATIYLAIDETSGLPVAIKVLFYHYCDNEIIRARFLDEGRIQAMLNHPNIVHVYKVISAPVLSFVMEYVDGGTLEDYLQEHSRLPEVEIIDLLLPVMSAVGFAHSKGIIHRDIKPSNVLLRRSAGFLEPKVMDFGVAKISSGRHLTTAGTTVGTLHYMSPEQIVGSSQIDGRADIYSLGCTLYKLCTGEVPFNAASEFALMMAQVEAEPRPPRDLRPDLSPSMEAVILKALAKKPEHRFQTIKEMTKALMHLGLPLEQRDTDTHTRPIPQEVLRFAMEADEVAQDQTSSFRLAKSDLDVRETTELDRLDDGGMTQDLSRTAVKEIQSDRLKAAERHSIQTSPLSREAFMKGADDDGPTQPRQKPSLPPKHPGEATTRERVSPKKLASLGLKLPEPRELTESQEVTALSIRESNLPLDSPLRSKESLVGFGSDDDDPTTVERPSPQHTRDPSDPHDISEDAKTTQHRPSALKAGFEAQQRASKQLPDLPDEEKTAQQRPSALKAGFEAQQRASKQALRPLSPPDDDDNEDATAVERPSGLGQALARNPSPNQSNHADHAQEIRLKLDDLDDLDENVQESQERPAPLFTERSTPALSRNRDTEVSDHTRNTPPWLTPGVLLGLIAVALSFVFLLVAYLITR